MGLSFGLPGFRLLTTVCWFGEVICECGWVLIVGS